MQDELADILTWPKALRSIQYELEIPGNREDFGLDGNLDLKYESAERYSDALRPQQHSLKEIIFCGRRYQYNDYSTVSSLHEFTALKRLALPR
jgi:hypothetical protein